MRVIDSALWAGDYDTGISNCGSHVLEALSKAMAIFEHHTAGCEFDPARSGAEWWSQVRQSGHREEGMP